MEPLLSGSYLSGHLSYPDINPKNKLLEKERINAWNKTEELATRREITEASCRTIQTGKINDKWYMEGQRKVKSFAKVVVDEKVPIAS